MGSGDVVTLPSDAVPVPKIRAAIGNLVDRETLEQRREFADPRVALAEAPPSGLHDEVACQDEFLECPGRVGLRVDVKPEPPESAGDGLFPAAEVCGLERVSGGVTVGDTDDYL
jgi:hypothetical protein